MSPFDAVIDTYITTVYQKDVAAHIAIFDNDIIAYDAWNDWSIEGIQNWRQMVKGWFNELDTVKDVVAFESVRTQESESIATLTAIVKFSGVDETGKTIRYLQNRFTWIAIIKNGSWKIIHQHSSFPIAFEGMKPLLQKD